MKSLLSLVFAVACGVAVAEEKAGGDKAVTVKEEVAGGRAVVEGSDEARKIVLAALERRTIPEVDFEGVSVEEAWDFVMIRYVMNGPGEGDQEALDIYFTGMDAESKAEAIKRLEADGKEGLLRPVEGVPRISYQGKNVPVLDLIKEIARVGRLDAYVTSAGIIMAEEGAPPFPNCLTKQGDVWKVVRQTAVAVKDEGAAKEKPAGNPVLAKLDQIVFPEVEIDGAALDEAWGYAQAGMMKYDPEENVNARGVTLMLTRGRKDEDGGDAGAGQEPVPGMTYRGKNIRFLDLVAEIARHFRLDAYLTEVGIIVLPEGVAPFPNPKAKEGEVWKVLRRNTADEARQLIEKGIVPVVDADDTSVAELLDFLRVRAAELQDPDRGKDKGVGVIERKPRAAEVPLEDRAGIEMSEEELSALPRVTMSMRGATFGAVLREMGRQAKLDIYLTTDGVLVRPAGAKAFKSEEERGACLVETIYRYEAPAK